MDVSPKSSAEAAVCRLTVDCGEAGDEFSVGVEDVAVEDTSSLDCSEDTAARLIVNGVVFTGVGMVGWLG